MIHIRIILAILVLQVTACFSQEPEVLHDIENLCDRLAGEELKKSPQAEGYYEDLTHYIDQNQNQIKKNQDLNKGVIRRLNKTIWRIDRMVESGIVAKIRNLVENIRLSAKTGQEPPLLFKFDIPTIQNTLAQNSILAFDFLGQFYANRHMELLLEAIEPLGSEIHNTQQFIQKIDDLLPCVQETKETLEDYQGKQDSQLTESEKQDYVLLLRDFATLQKNKRFALKYGLRPKESLEEMDYHVHELIDGTGSVLYKNGTVIIVYGGMKVGKFGAGEWDYIYDNNQKVLIPNPNQPQNFVQGEKQLKKLLGTPLPFLIHCPYALPQLMKENFVGGVYKGMFERFHQSWDSLYHFIYKQAELDQKLPSQLNFIVVGHSMGGGIAYLAALRLAALTFKGNPLENSIQVFTFGAPAIFSPGLIGPYNALLGKTTYTILNERDDLCELSKVEPLIAFYRPGYMIKTPAPNTRDPHNETAYQQSLELWNQSVKLKNGTSVTPSFPNNQALLLSHIKWLPGAFYRGIIRSFLSKPRPEFIELKVDHENSAKPLTRIDVQVSALSQLKGDMIVHLKNHKTIEKEGLVCDIIGNFIDKLPGLYPYSSSKIKPINDHLLMVLYTKNGFILSGISSFYAFIYRAKMKDDTPFNLHLNALHTIINKQGSVAKFFQQL